MHVRYGGGNATSINQRPVDDRRLPKQKRAGRAKYTTTRKHILAARTRQSDTHGTPLIVAPDI